MNFQYPLFICLCLSLLSIGQAPNLFGQTELVADGSTVRVDKATGSDHFYDYKIPDNITIDGVTLDSDFGLLEFYLVGGDGGRRKVNTLFGNCAVRGGAGAQVSVTFRIGSGPLELQPGGTIRFVPGYRGTSLTAGGVNGSGGGGGTAILYQSPTLALATDSDGDCTNKIDGEQKKIPSIDFNDASHCWILLAVAGGGGGAQGDGLCGGSEGIGGNDAERGWAGRGHESPGAGGIDGKGGFAGIEGTGAGGGYRDKGKGNPINAAGAAGRLNGANGGSDGSLQDGGRGYGSGGTGGENGGGGGGFSGGGGGGRYGGGGGGGSFVIQKENPLNGQRLAVEVKKVQGSTDVTPDHGFITYRFSRDEQKPVALCQDVVINMNGKAFEGVSPADADAGSYDLNGAAIQLDFCDIGSGGLCGRGNRVISCFDVGTTISQVLRVSNGLQESSCDFTIEINAGTPNLVCPANKTVLGDPASCQASVADGLAPLTTEGCDISLYYEIQEPIIGAGSSSIPGQGAITNYNFPAGTSTVTYHLSETEGTTTSCSFQITVKDEVAPVAACKNATVQVGETITNYEALVDNASYDNCGLSSLHLDKTTFGCNELGDNDVTLTVKDQGGNESSCTAVIHVQDQIAPILNCPVNTTVETGPSSCEATITGLAPISATDNCSVASLSHSVFKIVGNTINLVTTGSGPLNELTLEAGNFDVYYSIADQAANTGFCSFKISVKATPLAVSCPADITVSTQIGVCNSIISAGLTPVVIGSCFENLSYQIEEPEASAISGDGILSFHSFPLGTSQVSYTATEKDGRQLSCSFQVEVEDREIPVAKCQDQTIYLNEFGSTSITPAQIDNGSFDACSSVTLALDQVDFDCTKLNSITIVTLSVTDEDNNTATCSAKVGTLDQIPPEMSCRNNIRVYLDNEGLASFNPMGILVNSTDNCLIGQTMVDPPQTFTCDDLGDHYFTIEQSDLSGNKTSCTGRVTVLDNISPQLITQNISVSLDENGQATIHPDQLNDGSGDNCSIDQLSVNPNTFDCSHLGTNTVTLIAFDGAGNEARQTAEVNIVDTHQPNAICQNTTIQLDASGQALLDITSIDSGSSDNCGIVKWSLDRSTTFTCSDVGSLQVTLTVSDASDNHSSCTATILVEDGIPPTAQCQNITAQLDEAGTASIVAAQIDNGSNDACGITELYLNKNVFDCDDIGEQTVKLSVVDLTGNLSECEAVVTVKDEVVPTLVCQDLAITFNGEEAIPIPIDVIFLSEESFDACGSVSVISQSQLQVSCEEVGHTIAVEIIAKDPNGNTSSCTATVSVDGLTCGWEEMDFACESGADTRYDAEHDTYTLTSDGCHDYPGESITFVGRELCGDGEIIAHLADIDGQGYAGVMLREDLAPESRMVAVASNLTRNVRAEYRVSTGGNLFRKIKRRSGAEWFKIVRNGKKIISYSSANGISWKHLISVTMSGLPACLSVGLQAYSINKNAIVTATFDELIILEEGNNNYTSLPSISEGSRLSTEGLLEASVTTTSLKVIPNPFSTNTSINFYLSQAHQVQLQAYNLYGQKVRQFTTHHMEAGQHHFDWDGTASNGQLLAPGVYWVRLKVGEEWLVKKVSLVR